VLKGFARDRSLLGTMFTSGAAQAILAVSGIGAARILGVDDRGRLALFNLLPTMLVLLGTLGLPVAITYFIAREPTHARAIARTTLGWCAVLTFVLTQIHFVALLIVFRGQPHYVIVAAAISMPLVAANVTQLVGQALLQGQQRYKAFNWSRVGPALAYALGIVFLALTGDGTLFTLTLVFVLSSTVAGVLTLAVALDGLPPESAQAGPAPPNIRRLLGFGARAVLGAVYPSETFQLDQATVGLFLSSASLGLYVVAVAFTNLPRFIAQSLGVIAYPRIAGLRDPAAARAMVLRFTAASVVVAAVTCLALEATVGALVPLLFGSAFDPAVPVTRILLISSFIVSVRRVLADGLRGAGYPTLGTIGEGVAMLALFPALAVFIPSLGLRGAAIGVCISAGAGLTALVAVAAHRDWTGLDGKP
jgi:O-antigen/teichoic acid export membrane protein